MKCKSYNQFFEVMANKTRLKIIESLLESPKCVSDICSDVGEEQSTVSHNLKMLHNCHFVEKKTDGKRRIYSLNEITIKPLMKIVDKHVGAHCTRKCWVKK